MKILLGLSPIEYAIKEKRMDVLPMLVGAIPRAKSSNFEQYKQIIINSLESLPDLCMEMNFHCDSSIIPFVNSFTPSDTYKVLFII